MSLTTFTMHRSNEIPNEGRRKRAVALPLPQPPLLRSLQSVQDKGWHMFLILNLIHSILNYKMYTIFYQKPVKDFAS